MVLLLLSITIAVAGQFLFKIGASQLGGGFDVMAWLFNLPLMAGFACYFASALIYIYALRAIPLSIAYPTLALGYVMVVAISVVALGEPLSVAKAAGVALICAGVGLLWA